MRVALLAVVLVACGGAKGRPCRALPVPPASAFEGCGGMLYHAPPGSSAAYTIRFVNKVSSDFELLDVCVLLDGAPIFAKKGDTQWTGKLANVRHTVEVQVAFKPNVALPDEDVTKKYTVYLRAAQEIAAADGAELELIVAETGDKSAPPSERLTITATLPDKTRQPRCE